MHQSSGHLRRSVRRCWARKRSRSMNLTHLAAGHPVAGTHLSEVRTDPAAAGDRDRATRMKHAARRRIDRARLTGLNLRPASTLGSGAGTASRRARVWALTHAGSPDPQIDLVCIRRHDPSKLQTPSSKRWADVRFTPKSEHRSSMLGCPLCAKSGLMHCNIKVSWGPLSALLSPKPRLRVSVHSLCRCCSQEA